MTEEPIKCLIVDDEPLATRVLEKHINKIDHLKIVGVAHNAIEAFNILNQEEVDLIFLDIKMPRITGLEFMRSLKSPPHVILTTAYREYALEGFELEVLDYLLKPISLERFLRAISKFPKKRTSSKAVVGSHPEVTRGFIFVKEGKRMKKVQFEDILFIESIKDYVKITTRTENTITCIKIGYLEENLPRQFLRTHKSFIINSDKLTAYSTSEIEISNSTIPIGRFYKQSVQQFLDGLSV